MARDGSGTYARTQPDYVFNTVIDEAKVNSELNDIATEITNSIDKGGRTTWTGNQNAGSTKITALAVGTANTDSITLGQSQDGGFKYAAGTGTDTITMGLSPAMTAYVAGQHFYFKQAAGANTGATTLNIDSVGAKAITKKGTTALAAGDIPASAMVHVVYDGTQFQLLNVGTYITADSTDTLTNKSYDLGGTGNVLTGSLAEFNTALQSESFATLAGVESLTNKTFSGKLGAFLDTNGNYIQNEQGTDIASATPTVPTDGDYFDVTGTTGISTFTVAADRLFTLQFDGIVTLTHGAALILPADTNITTAAGDILIFKSTTANNVIMTGGIKADGTAWVGGSVDVTTKGDLQGYSSVGARVPVGTNGQIFVADSIQTLGVKYFSPTDAIGGLKLTNDGSDADHDINIAVGYARSVADDDTMVLSGALIKQIDATWAVGTNAGGMDSTDTVAATTGYGVYLIRRSDTGVVDVMFSSDMTAAGSALTMPTNYDQKRLIGWVMTDGSANIYAFQQSGDYFRITGLPPEILVDGTITANTYETLITQCPPLCEAALYLLSQDAAATVVRSQIIMGGAGETVGSNLHSIFAMQPTSAATIDNFACAINVLTSATGTVQYSSPETTATTVRLTLYGCVMHTRSNP